jgi:hypothetical protein
MLAGGVSSLSQNTATSTKYAGRHLHRALLAAVGSSGKGSFRANDLKIPERIEDEAARRIG